MQGTSSEVKKRKARSVSQVKSFRQCSYQYFLERIEKVWQRPAFWFPHGTAVHSAAEAVERSGRTMTVEEAQEVFSEEYSKEVAKYAEHTPNFNVWWSSGRYRGAEDGERRWKVGREQVASYVDYYYNKAPNEVIWIAPDGTPAIELGFEIEIGDVPVRGFIDQVIDVGEDKAPIVRDIKTGQNPGDDFQLSVYAEAIEQQYGVRPETGDYWMAKQGKPTRPYDLSYWTSERLAEEFAEVDDAINRGDFPANPGKACERCSVKTSCEFAI